MAARRTKKDGRRRREKAGAEGGDPRGETLIAKVMRLDQIEVSLNRGSTNMKVEGLSTHLK